MLPNKTSKSPPSRNKTLLQTFEWHTPTKSSTKTSHYTHLTNLLPHFSVLGITTLCLPPGSKANNPQGNGYDCYDLWDLGEFDQKGSRGTKWGCREELKRLIAEARGLGVECWWDAVLNHKAGGDAVEEGVWGVEVDPEDRRVEIASPQQIDAWLRFDFPGRGERYSALKWRAEHFNGTDWDHRRRRKAIFKLIDDPAATKSSLPSSKHVRPEHAFSSGTSPSSKPSPPIPRPGKDWAIDVDPDNGNNDYLMFSNIYHSHPAVREDLLRWGEWMVTEVSIGGFRLDAARHFSLGFAREWIARVWRAGRENGKREREVSVVGEVWTDRLDGSLRWLDGVVPPLRPSSSLILLGTGRGRQEYEEERASEDGLNDTEDDERGGKREESVRPKIYAYDAPLLHAFSKLSASFPSAPPLDNESPPDTTNSSSSSPPFPNPPPPKPKHDPLTLQNLSQGTLLSARPNQAITLVTTHDTQPGQTCSVPMPQPTKMLWYAYILLRREGTPCVFWGDLLGTCGPEGEGPVGSYYCSGREYCEEGNNGEGTEGEEDWLGWSGGLGVLMGVRARFAYGAQRDYFACGERVMGWTREGREGNGGVAVVLSVQYIPGKSVRGSGVIATGSTRADISEEEKMQKSRVRMNIGRPGDRYVNIFGAAGQVKENDWDDGAVVIDEAGTGNFGCRPWAVSVYVREDQNEAVEELRREEKALREKHKDHMAK